MGLGNILKDARTQRGLTASQVASATRMKVQMVEAIEREDFSDVAAPIYGKGFIKLFAEHVGVDPAPLIKEYVDVHVHHKPPSLGADTRDLLLDRQPQAEPEPSEEDADETPPLVPDPPSDPEDDLFTRTDAQDPLHQTSTPAEASDTLFDAPDADVSESFTAEIEPLSATGQAETSAPAQEPEAETRVLAPIPRNVFPHINLKNIDFSEAPLKTIGIIVGLVVLVIFLLSAISRCVTRPDDGRSDRSLQLAIDPPDPYLE